jgi:hypothetical protein
MVSSICCIREDSDDSSTFSPPLPEEASVLGDSFAERARPSLDGKPPVDLTELSIFTALPFLP